MAELYGWFAEGFATKDSPLLLLRDRAFSTDLTTQVTALDLPVYFFSGIHDYTVNYTLSKGYFEKLQAPVKGFYTFEQSARQAIRFT